MAEPKICSACGVPKPRSEFHTRKASKDGLHASCKGCKNKSQKAVDQARRAGPAADYEPDAARIEQVQSYGTPMQRGSAAAFLSAGSIEGAAAAMQITPELLRAHLSELERRAALRGWSPAHDMTKPTPFGFHVKGVSTLYSKNQETGELELRGQWVKSAKDPDQRLAVLMEAVASIAEPFRGKADPVKSPASTILSKDLLNVIPMGDPHFGMFAWMAETGNNFDLKIAESGLFEAVDKLVDIAPPADECLIINLGDFFHADNSTNQTLRSHHALDVDGRWSKVLSVGIRAMRRCIDRALERHQRVRVICEIGNHDDHSSIMLALCLANYYEREPRVFIDTSPNTFHWYRFGLNLIGTTHGHTVKADKLGQIMAHDRAKDWGETLHRYFYCGHVHHDSLKEVPGVIIETFRTLAARDAWHNAAGYRAGRDLKLDVIHRERGRIQRFFHGLPVLGLA